MLDGPGLLHRVGGGQGSEAAGLLEIEAAQEPCYQPRPVGIAGAGRVDLLARRRGGDLDRPAAGLDAGAVAAEGGDHDLGKLEQPGYVSSGPLLDQLQLVVVADHDPGSPAALLELRLA